MIILAPPHPQHAPPPTASGFAWRYVDVVDAAGDGAVLIWGWALPFLVDPETRPAVERPFLNLVVYQGGRPTFYHLEVFDPATVVETRGGWRFGGSLLQSGRSGDRWTVRASLDLPVAGSTGRARGTLILDGAAAHGHPSARGPHTWSVLSAPAEATLSLETPAGTTLLVRGRAYHDENRSDRPLTELGIRQWDWGHVAEPGQERVHYRVEGGAPAVGWELRLAADGRINLTDLDAWAGEGRVGGRWGLSAPARLRVGATEITAGAAVDQSSFYLRFPLQTASGRGWGERVRPEPIGSWWMQPLVQTCVTRPDGGSMLLPWFTGPRTDRLARTWSWWWT